MIDEDDYRPGSPKVGRWSDLYQRVVELLSEYGQEDAHVRGDFWVHEDYWGYPQVKVYLGNLALLKTPLIPRLRSLLSSFPGHEIIVAIDGEEHWPRMGLTIRAHEIIDGLQRQHFPAEYRSLTFEGSRPGTERD